MAAATSCIPFIQPESEWKAIRGVGEIRAIRTTLLPTSEGRRG